MWRNFNKTFLIAIAVLIFSCVSASARTVTLNARNEHVVVEMPGTVKFQLPNDLHVRKAREEGLREYQDLAFSAAIIYDSAFCRGYLCSRGKIFNYTQNPITVECKFYNGNKLLYTNIVRVKPRTFMRMLPDGGRSLVPDCTDIICILK